MPDGRKNNGGARKGAGRKPKVEEQKLVEKLSPLEAKAHQALKKAIEEREQWAVKLFFEYMYGKPTQKVENDISVKSTLPSWLTGNLEENDGNKS